jgi:hypothetical protein
LEFPGVTAIFWKCWQVFENLVTRKIKFLETTRVSQYTSKILKKIFVVEVDFKNNI